MSSLSVINPFSGVEIAQFPYLKLGQCKSIFSQLKSSQVKWSNVDIDKRINLVMNALIYFENNKSIIAKDISIQMGRPLHQCQGEINGMLERAKYMCSIAKDTLSEDVLTDQKGFERRITHSPLGVIFVIAAWNYPLLITINSVIPALLAGNTVLLKHSSLTPLIGKHFEKAFSKLGKYDHLLEDIIVDHKTTGEIIETLDINHVIFTGSVNGGKQILKHTATKFMMPGLELGGKDAAYVDSSANLQYAAETIVDGAMFNSGQSCCGMERAYIHKDVYEEFLTIAKDLIKNYKLGNPEIPETNMGPLATKKAAHMMQEQVDEATKMGAKVLSGGKIKLIDGATFFEPTLLKDTNHSMQIMIEENFGPILPVMKVNSIDEAIDLINDNSYGLTSAIFTQNKEMAQDFSDKVDTGTVFMNRCDYLDPALPWTGVKNSGCGSSLSKYGFFHVTRRKSIHFKIID